MRRTLTGHLELDDSKERIDREEVHRFLGVTASVQNAARWMVAVVLGLRQSEVLGLQWSDLDLANGTLIVRRQLQRRVWAHGCGDRTKCTKRGADCPLETSRASCGIRPARQHAVKHQRCQQKVPKMVGGEGQLEAVDTFLVTIKTCAGIIDEHVNAAILLPDTFYGLAHTC